MDVTELERIAASELAKHGLHDWTFRLASTKRRLGVCKYRTKRIEIAEYYARNSPAEKVHDTLMHEIAHALAGPAAHHGPAWKTIALRLGATPRACDDSVETALMPGDWQATCPACTRTYHRYKRPNIATGYRCRCPAHATLIFEFQGDPAHRPVVPMSLEEAANWEAKCAGCEFVHLRVRRPRAGLWRCKCPRQCELTWRFRSRGSQR